MTMYHTLGRIPRKRHTVFRQERGQLFHEQLVGSRGFSGPSSLLYHIRRPTSVLATRVVREFSHESDPNLALRMRHFHLTQLPQGESPVLDRVPVLFNRDVSLSFAMPTTADRFFYRNAQADE